MVLASLLDRSLGISSGLVPRRLSRFERSGDMALEEGGGVPTTPPPPMMTPRQETAPAPPVRLRPDVPPPVQQILPVERVESVEHVRVDRIVKEPAAPVPPVAGAKADDAPFPAASPLPRPVEMPVIDAPGARRGRRAAAPQPDAAPQKSSAETLPVPTVEKVHVIEQRLETLSREWSRETRVEHIRDVIRSGEPPAPMTRRAAAPPPVAQPAPMRQERLRPAIAATPVPAPDPVVEVHIGRVELRATVAPPPRAPNRAAARPDASLATYLRKRDGH